MFVFNKKRFYLFLSLIILGFLGFSNFSFGATNIVTNGTFTPGSTGWTIVQNGGNGCAFGGAVTSSYNWCIVSQTINLASATGYTSTQLDAAPPLTFSLQYNQRGDKTNTKYFIEVKLLAGDGTTVIASSLYGSQASPLTISSNYSQWNTITSNLSGYGEGARYVSIKFGGEDGVPDWGGHFGPAFTNVSFSLDDTDTPVISSFSPTDDSTDVGIDSNLVLNFNEAVNIGTGNIVIKKSSDDSVFETIDVTSSNVTGSGSATITINPTGTFSGQTDYYVQIDTTAFDDTSNNDYEGILDNTTWNFTTEDTSIPTLSNVIAYTSSQGAIITWDTNEDTSALVSYGLTSDCITNTSESDLSPRDKEHSVSISNLVSCTRYYYKTQSIDANTNTGYSSVGTFKTTGCTGDSTITATGQAIATDESGGTVTQDNISITIPASFKEEVDSAIFQVNKLDNSSFLNEAGVPSNFNQVGTDVYALKALTNENTNISNFDSAITITMTYLDNEISNLDESTLWIYRYDGSSWNALSNCVVDQSINTVTCDTNSFSDFGLFGERIPVVASSGSSSGSGIHYGCKDPKALNYDYFSAHNPSLCEYTDEVIDIPTTSVVPVISNTIIINEIFTKNLKFGIIDLEVKNLQKYLNKEGFILAESGVGSIGEETNYFGKLTKGAVIKFQLANGLVPDGIVGSLTRAMLNK